MMRNRRTYVVNLHEVNIACKTRKEKLEKHRNVHEVSESLLVNLEAPAVAVHRRDDKYVQRKLNLSKCFEKSKLKSSRTALSFILCPDYSQVS